MKKTFYLPLIFLFLFNSIRAQVKRYDVRDSTINTPVSNVEIFIDGKKVSKTDEFGGFKISIEVSIPAQITLKHPLYKEKTIWVDESLKVIFLDQNEKINPLSEVVLETAKDRRSAIILPSAMVTSEVFENYGPIDVISAINQIPGVFVLSGSLNTNRMTIRGIGARTPFGTNKIKAYFNGIPITNGIGETAFEVYDPENIQNIEIVKGPKGTAHGTHLGGALLIETKKVEKDTVFLKNSFTLGSFDLLKNSFTTGFSEGKFDLNLHYDHLQTKGYRQNSAYDRNATLLDLGYHINSKNRLQFLFNQINYRAGIASSISNTAFGEDPKQAAANWLAAQGFEDNKQSLLGISLEHKFNERLHNTTSIFYSYLDHYEPRPFNILDEFTNGYGFRTVFDGNIRFLATNTTFSIGAEAFNDEYNWKTIENLYRDNGGQGSLEGAVLSDNKEYRKQFNAFSLVTLPVGTKLQLQLGLNLNKTSYVFRDYFNAVGNNRSAQRSFDPILAPSVNFLYHITHANNVYANISRGFSFPNLEETLTPEGIINPDIGPETGINYEIGSKMSFLDRNLHFHISAYYMDIENLLVAQRVGEDQYIGRNAGKTSHKGFEIETKYRYEFSGKWSATPFLNINFNNHKFIDFMDEDNDYSGNRLTGVPDKTINGGLGVLHQSGLYITSTFQHIGEIPITDANSVYSDPFNVFNLKTGYKTRIFKLLNFEINGGINNIFDEKYASSVLINAVGFGNTEPRYYYPGLPINFFGGFKVEHRF